MLPKISWFATSLLSALAAILLALIACLLPNRYAIGLIILGVVVFLFTLSLNPAHRYWRMATTLAGALVASQLVPKITVGFSWGDNTFGHFLIENPPDATFNVTT